MLATFAGLLATEGALLATEGALQFGVYPFAECVGYIRGHGSDNMRVTRNSFVVEQRQQRGYLLRYGYRAGAVDCREKSIKFHFE
jgi:hypothetical protein